MASYKEFSIRKRNKVTGHWATASLEWGIDKDTIYNEERLDIDNFPKRMPKKLKNDLLLVKNWEVIDGYYTVMRGDNGGLIAKRIDASEVSEETIDNDIASGIKFRSAYDAELFIHNIKNKGEH